MGCGGSKEESQPQSAGVKKVIKHGFTPDRAAEERVTQMCLLLVLYGREKLLDHLEVTAPAMSAKRSELLEKHAKAKDEQFARAVARAFLELGATAAAKATDAAHANTQPILDASGAAKDGSLSVHPRASFTAENHYVLNENRLIPPFPAGLHCCVFAAGCFWGTEKGFWRLPGVYSTAVGYIGGKVKQPDYRSVCSGRTGHTEGTLVVWDPAQISLADLLRRFFDCHDPTQGDGQGNDVGTQYRSGIYPSSDEQAAVAKACLQAYDDALSKHGFGRITTEVHAGLEFWYAEEYHQQYLAKPKARQYCSAEPTGIAVPPFSTWNGLSDTATDKYQPLLPEAFWAAYDGSIRAPHWPAELNAAALAEAAELKASREAARAEMEAGLRATKIAILRFCGGCGFRPRAEELAEHLLSATGLEVGLVQDVGTTGNFDFEAKASADASWKLVHSKKAGDGFVDTDEKMTKLVRALASSQSDAESWVKDKLPRALKFMPIEAAKEEERRRLEAIKDESAALRLREEVDMYISMAPALIFSKSYCGFCKKAKELFASAGVYPVCFELDHRFNGPSIQEYLFDLTGQKTVPSIWIDSKHIGGFSDFEKLVKSGKLKDKRSLRAETLAIVKAKGLTECGAADGVPCLCGAAPEQLQLTIKQDQRDAESLSAAERRQVEEAELKYPGCVIGTESIMSQKTHGTSEVAMQQTLRFGVNHETAERVCNFNRHFAEHAGYFEETAFLDEVLEADKKGETFDFFDPNTGERLFTLDRAQRPIKVFLSESRKHGWPSFRTHEVNWEAVRVLPNGEVVSKTGTHLGHNLKDRTGNRFCINLVSVAGQPQALSDSGQ